MVWKRENIERWIAAGERDASEAIAAGAVSRLVKTFA
jgi:hypothetical protein